MATLTRGIPQLIDACCVSCPLHACTRDQKVVDKASVLRARPAFDEAEVTVDGCRKPNDLSTGSTLTEVVWFGANGTMLC